MGYQREWEWWLTTITPQCGLKNFADTRGRRERQTEDEAWRKSSSNWKRGRASNPENHHFLGWSSRSVASRGHPYRQIKKTTIGRQSSNWEKGLRKQSSLQKGAQLASSLTQVKLHLLNFRADDPNNWEVAEFLPERVSNQGLLTFGSRFNTIARRKRKSNDHICLQKKTGQVYTKDWNMTQVQFSPSQAVFLSWSQAIFVCIK